MRTIIFAALTLLALPGLLRADTITSPGDLNLDNVVKAINFGLSADFTIGSTTFLNANHNTTVDGVTTNAGGSYFPGQFGSNVPTYGGSSDDLALEQILGSYVDNSTFGVGLEIDLPNGNYEIQLLLYEGWLTSGRLQAITVEGATVEASYDLYAEQGNSFSTGSVFTHATTLSDGTLNIGAIPADGNASNIRGLIITQAVPEPSSFALAALGLVGLGGIGLRDRRRRER